MAGIVASTLRRRTFRHKASIDARIQAAVEPGCPMTSLSPTAAAVGGNSGACELTRVPSRSSSIRRSFSAGRSPSRRAFLPKGAKLFHEDFWPNCINPSEPNLRLVKFDSFDTLVPKANAWLHENIDIVLVKCETLEKKISSIDQVTADCMVFAPKGNFAMYMKGLRLWFVYNADTSRAALKNTAPAEIGYMNVIPKCLDTSTKYPVYENLPDTYTAINAYLVNSPLEGKVLTIETVPLKLARKLWAGPDHLNPDQTYFPDEYLHHVLYITRIYFLYGTAETELIGAQDFLPDFEPAANCLSLASLYPRYQPIVSAMDKAKKWIDTARNIRITNIQTLEAIYRTQPENVHTGINFIEKAESSSMIRFLRITYVRPATEENSSSTATTSSNYHCPPGFSYRTFIPAAVKVGMCSGAPEYETFTATWERSKAWLKCIDRRVICAESFYHPLRHIWHGQDGAETTVLHGEWTTSHRGEWRYQRRRRLVHIVRVYLDGDYQEPDASQLPPSPMVEEVNDCRCIVM